MIGRKLCGYDVNGWRDSAACNWDLRPGDEEQLGVRRLVEGAVLSDVVRAGDGRTERWIGGPQADLAPHGRGGGWGNVGAADRRRTVRSLIRHADAAPEILAAAFTGLCQGSRQSVVSIEDSEETTEALQERFLAAVAIARIGPTLLVWRSVLSVLHALDAGTLGGAARDGASIGIIGHVGAGFSAQVLCIRAEMRRGGGQLAPERRACGRLVPSPLGYDGLVAAATTGIMDLAPNPRADHFRSARAIGRLAFGLPVQLEPLRRANGDWDILIPPDRFDIPAPGAGVEPWPDALRDCDAILFESLVEGPVREALLARLAAVFAMPVVALPSAAVASGALVAAQRHAAGQTVYFDFLPRMATIVQTLEGAISYDLIGDNETLPAGSLYRSPRPARFALLAGQERFQVYLKKETQDQPRRALIDVGIQAPQTAPVNLWVEQMPAAGRAKILLQAPSLSRQFTVDWDSAEVLDASWEDILMDLAMPPPTIPQRLVLPCGMHGWEDNPKGPGLITLLQENARKSRPDWAALAAKLSARPFGRYCISSDGDLPADAPGSARGQLDDLTQRAMAFLQRMNVGSMPPDTAPLRFLTWQFRRCPPKVAAVLLDAWQQRLSGTAHPLAPHPKSWILIRQGLGRIVWEPEHEQRALSLLLQMPVDLWRWQEETAAAAFLLSRSDMAPTLLERADLDRLGARVVQEFEVSVGSEYTRFAYAPLLLGGLLRWRTKAPRALVAGHDRLADDLLRVVEMAMNDILSRSARLPKIKRVGDRWLPILSATVDELNGVGKKSDLLAAIYGASDANASDRLA